MLRSREVTPDAPNYPNNALHVHQLNVDVAMRNRDMLHALTPESKQYACDARLATLTFQAYLIRDQKLVVCTVFSR